MLKPVIVIIGGGFAGIELVKKLKDQFFEIFLIDKRNYHTFQPLLYQVASGGLDTSSIAYPYRKLFSGYDDFHFRMAEVLEINTDNQIVITSTGNIRYDTLVIGTGAQSNFFGLKNVELFSMPLKTVPDALDLRSDILQEFEKAIINEDPDKQKILMNFVIVGGGPTGVETAGALAEFKKFILEKDYPELDKRRMRVHLIEATSSLLGAMSKQASLKAEEYLREMGVRIWLNVSVKDYDGINVYLSNGVTLKTDTLIWSAGVTGSIIRGIDGRSIAAGRFKVDAFNKIDGFDNIYAIGDCAAMISPENPKGHPMLATVAMQQGRTLAKNLIRVKRNRKPMPFKFKDPGTMATIGRNKAVVDLPYIKFQGMFAWFVWTFVHLMSLVSFRNRLLTFFAWMWNYFTYENALRLIIRPYKKPGLPGEKLSKVA